MPYTRGILFSRSLLLLPRSTLLPLESALDRKKRGFYLWSNILGFFGMVFGLIYASSDQRPGLVFIGVHLVVSVVSLWRGTPIAGYEKWAAAGMAAFTLILVGSTWLNPDPLELAQALDQHYRLFFLTLVVLHLFVTDRGAWRVSALFTLVFSGLACARTLPWALEGQPGMLLDFVRFFLLAGVTAVFLNVFGAYREQLVREQLLSSTDPLTGAQNRRPALALLEQLEQGARPYSVVVLDVDHFKHFNDQHGHLAGDRALVELVQCCHAMAGVTHTVRWGGEEFLLILPDTRLDQAHALAERLRSALEAHTWGEGLRITTSLGVAERTPGEAYPRTLIRADAALYAAKRGGRNQVMAAPAPLEPLERLVSPRTH